MTTPTVGRAAALGIVTAVVAAGLTVGTTAPASAHDRFGDHVRSCAQTMGFDGEHNPGMHRGASGWHPDHTC
jgi:hypothetical protein